jgi:protein-glutamine gamma-glutamyltransferase
LLFALPWLIWLVLNGRARSGNDVRTKAYNSFNAASYYLNQLGYTRHNQSPSAFAMDVDSKFASSFASFTNVYQKLKYSTTPLTQREQEVATAFYPAFIKQIRQRVPFKTRVSKFLNIYNTLHYFTKPKIK